MDKFQNKYRISSARLQTWDYANNGAYFITICTHNRTHFFGKIVTNSVEDTSQMDAAMQLTEIGLLAEKFWLEIPNHFPFVELGNFVIMPNHTHGILIINKPELKDEELVDTDTALIQKNTQLHKIGGKNEKWKSETIGVIINQYKRIVTIHARKVRADFAWQSRFHDHIIQNMNSFETIQNYIANNPIRWAEDKFYEPLS